VNDAFGTVWTEVFVAYLKALPQNLLGGTEEDHENPIKGAGFRTENPT
jgi:hypothetical protein